MTTIPPPSETDIVIVGGGLAGLTAAAFAAGAGRRVVLLEKSGSLGGRAKTLDKGGFRLNVGPHALYRGGQAMAALKELGIAPKGGTPPAKGVLLWGWYDYPLPYAPWGLLTSSMFGWRDKWATAKFLGGLMKRDPAPLATVNFGRWLEDLKLPERTRLFVRALARVATYAYELDKISAGAALMQMQLAFSKSVSYLDGGWEQLVDALAVAARDKGAVLATGVGVEEILVDHRTGAAAGVVTTHGTSIKARAVVLALGPNQAVELAGLARCPDLYQHVETLPRVEAFCLDLALEKLPQPEPTFVLGVDRPLYMSVHSAVADLAPQGGAVVHLARYLGTREAVDQSVYTQELEEFLDRFQPGWRPLEKARRVLPRAIVSYCLPEAAAGGLGGRPPVAVAEFPGVFLAGDWVGDTGHLADGALASARAAAQAACEAREKPNVDE